MNRINKDDTGLKEKLHTDNIVMYFIFITKSNLFPRATSDNLLTMFKFYRIQKMENQGLQIQIINL
jgi:hypothetical protein